LTPGNRLPSFPPPSHIPCVRSYFYYKHMKTFSAKPHEVERKWYVIDAKGKVLGQVAVEAARLLRGKHKPTFTSHVDTGDFVVVINADQVVLTGTKETSKIYTRFSGYVGGQKVETPRLVRERRPILLVERAVWGMIPKTRLGRTQFGKLKVYAGEEHPHEAQAPVAHLVK
jgi:large subunit ribosomal protein L13